MTKKKPHHDTNDKMEQNSKNAPEEITDNLPQETEENTKVPETEESTEDTNAETEKLLHTINELNDKYLRLSAEFDNYRKRTLKEKLELTKTAGENIFTSMLPVIDDLERGLKHVDESDNVDALKEGMTLIYNKFKSFLNQKGVTEIESVNQVFDTDIHEAVTKIPAPSPEMKGKVLDCIEKGYKLSDKVIRYSKVVVCE